MPQSASLAQARQCAGLWGTQKPWVESAAMGSQKSDGSVPQSEGWVQFCTHTLLPRSTARQRPEAQSGSALHGSPSAIGVAPVVPLELPLPFALPPELPELVPLPFDALVLAEPVLEPLDALEPPVEAFALVVPDEPVLLLLADDALLEWLPPLLPEAPLPLPLPFELDDALLPPLLPEAPVAPAPTLVLELLLPVSLSLPQPTTSSESVSAARTFDDGDMENLRRAS